MQKNKSVFSLIIKLVFCIIISANVISFSTAKYKTTMKLPEITLNIQPQFYVTFDSNGGTIENMEDKQGYIVEENITKKIVNLENEYGILPNVTPPEGYSFVGWYTEKSEGTRVDNNSLFNTVGNVLLYARFGKEYKIQYSENALSVLNSEPIYNVTEANITLEFNILDINRIQIINMDTGSPLETNKYNIVDKKIIFNSLENDIYIDVKEGDYLTDYLYPGEVTKDNLTIKYLGDNTYVLNGRKPPTNNTTKYTVFIMLTEDIKIYEIPDSEKNKLLLYPQNILEVGDKYSFSVDVISGTFTGKMSTNNFRVNFRSLDKPDGGALDVAYDFVDGLYYGQKDGIAKQRFSAITVYIGRSQDLTFDNFTFKINLDKISESPTTYNNAKSNNAKINDENIYSTQMQNTLFDTQSLIEEIDNNENNIEIKINDEDINIIDNNTKEIITEDNIE